MPSLNKVFLIGNLTREIELSYSPKGTPIAALGLAVNRVWTDEENRKHEEATFVDVTLWARLAEIADKYLRKGSPVFIEGRLQLDTWEDNGQKHSRLRVVGQSLQLLGSKRLDLCPPAPDPASTPPEGSKIAPVSSSTRPPARVAIEPDLDVEPF
jgi:single-strand DNA-binding protein